MHQSVAFVHLLANELQQKLIGAHLTKAYSLSKEECVLVFQNNHETISLNFRISWRSLLVFYATQLPSKISNSRALFEKLYDKQIQQLVCFENERLFCLQYDNQLELVFKLYGPLTNIILQENGETIEQFRDDILSDQQFSIAPFKSFTNTVSSSHKIAIVKDELRGYRLLINAIPSNDVIFETHSVLEAYTEFSRLFDSFNRFKQTKESLLNTYSKRFQKLSVLLEKTQTAIHELKNDKTCENTGHIIMANLHIIQPGSNTVELFDFYQNKPVQIKLKSNLSAQENAQVYYLKQKNKGKELAVLNSRVALTEKECNKVEQSLAQIKLANSLKELKPFIKEKKEEVEKQVPFYVFDFKGYQIWAGKNAVNNDLLTTKFAHKNDLWLHAKGVSGSHVIIRNHSNTPLPQDIIEKAAQIAAYYSKAKGSTWVAVAYTQKKFVRKPKGSEPGQVIVEKENSILVQPELI